ncbi:MAG: hypothetical protein WD801_02375 [Gemmatimonadaceae bacterium]
MRLRSVLLLSLPLAFATVPSPALAQGRVIDLTVEMLDRWFTAREKQKGDEKNLEPQLVDLDSKIKKYQDCKRDFEAGGAAVGGAMGRLGARAGIRAKCGSTDDASYQKDRLKILAGPEAAGATAGGFKLDDYRTLTTRLEAYMGGDESGFSRTGLDLLKSRHAQLASALGVPAVLAELAGASRSMGTGGRGPATWNTDYAWVWIAELFAVQYLSGATMFESDYKPGEWTRWQLTAADSEGESQFTERAFLGKTAEGAEWWRMKTITNYLENGKVAQADTVSLEALFKPLDADGGVQQLVRMRGKLPGNAEAQEMMVPEQWSMWNMRGAFSMKPTKESIEGATIGTEEVRTPAGTFRAKHVRFGQGNGTIDWWLDETAVGGWVKFAAIDNEKKPQYTMELIAKGTGAQSELGVTIK